MGGGGGGGGERERWGGGQGEGEREGGGEGGGEYIVKRDTESGYDNEFCSADLWAQVKHAQVCVSSPGNNVVSHGNQGVCHVARVFDDLLLIGLEPWAQSLREKTTNTSTPGSTSATTCTSHRVM